MNDDVQRLHDILVAVGDAERLVSRGRPAFDADPLAVRSAKNIVTEIGEAAKAIGVRTTSGMPDIPWRTWAGMRDRTIHRYPEVDLDVLWETLIDDVPKLAMHIDEYLRDLPGPRASANG